MTKNDIFAILDKNVKTRRTGFMIGTVVGAILLIVALIMLLTESDMMGTALIGGLGLLVCILTTIPLLTKSIEKQTNGIKDVLNNNPSHLVWAYVFKQNNRGAVSVNVVMNFKDGKTFQVDQTAIPNNDCDGFMRVLTELNPQMHLGYSEELEYKFKKKTL